LDGPRTCRVGGSDRRGGAWAGGRVWAVHWRMEGGPTGRGDWRTSRGGVGSGTVRESGGASWTIVGVRGRLQEATIGCEGRVGGKVVMRDGVLDGDGRSGPLWGARQGFVADHGIEGDIKVKVLEDQIRVLVALSCS
jgi:hypothetical protein